MKKVLDRDLELLYEVGSLRHVQRSWRQFFGCDVANDLEHTIRVQYLALIMAKMEGVTDEATILKMALLHDLAEARTGDQNWVHKKYGKQDEDVALHHALEGTQLEENEALMIRYIKRECKESQIVKDADHLDVDLELAELTVQGHHLPKMWAEGRKKTMETKFYTKSAKKIWEAIQSHDPQSWQLRI